MKNALSTWLLAGLLTACGSTENTKNSAASSSAATTEPATAATPKPRNCQSVVTPDKLDKPLVYKESAKPITISLTLGQDTSSVQTAGGCVFNNTITVLATKKSGSQYFKRTLLKDDLRYYIKDDAILERAVLQSVLYKPTFNGERYFLLVMQLLEPVSKKTVAYTLFVNYNGEILKVK